MFSLQERPLAISLCVRPFERESPALQQVEPLGLIELVTTTFLLLCSIYRPLPMQYQIRGIGFNNWTHF